MEQPTRILVPLDLSTRSEVGLDYGAMLAAAFDAELVVMINVNLPERAVLEGSAESEAVSLEDAAEAALQSLLDTHAPDVTSSIAVRFRDFPAEGILEVVADVQADMIVVASHGRSGMTRWMLGSIAEKISRNAEVPVVIVPARDDRPAL